jgi:hypothetical protein
LGDLKPEDIGEDLPDFSVAQILDRFTLAVKNSLRKLGIVIHDGIAKVKTLFAGEVHTDKLCVGQTCVTEDELKGLLQKASAEQASGGGALPPPSAPPVENPPVDDSLASDSSDNTSSDTSGDAASSTPAESTTPAEDL